MGTSWWYVILILSKNLWRMIWFVCVFSSFQYTPHHWPPTERHCSCLKTTATTQTWLLVPQEITIYILSAASGCTLLPPPFQRISSSSTSVYRRYNIRLPYQETFTLWRVYLYQGEPWKIRIQNISPHSVCMCRAPEVSWLLHSGIT